MISVLIVDDHEVVRLGLVTLLRRQPGIQVVGEAGNAQEALEQVARHRPRVVIMDVRMGEVSGIEACREIIDHWPDTRVLMLTSYADETAATAAVIAGAAGFLLKGVPAPELVRSITAVGQGENLIDPALVTNVLHQIRTVTGATEPGLTEQEHNVLSLLGEGKTNREIGQLLFLSEKTVRNYVSNILQKLNMTNRTQAAAYATRKRLLGGGG